MNKSSLYISIFALIVSVAALAVSSKNCNKETATAPATTVAVKASDVAAALNSDPSMVINALQKYEQDQREIQARQSAQLMMENIEEVNNDPNTPYVGDKNADVVLVEFFDFSCGYCKRLAPAIKQIVNDNPDIKVVFKPITFVSPISKYAAQAALAANEQGKFLEVYDALLMSEGGLNEAKINEIVEKAGLNMDKFKKDVNSDKVLNTISSVAALGQKVQVNGVPALFLNGTQLQVIEAEGIQAEINKVK